jgi:ABC-type spermidine/putrescine transport system permease subunit I
MNTKEQLAISLLIAIVIASGLTKIPLWLGIIHHVGWLISILLATWYFGNEKSLQKWAVRILICYIIWPFYVIFLPILKIQEIKKGKS